MAPESAATATKCRLPSAKASFSRWYSSSSIFRPGRWPAVGPLWAKVGPLWAMVGPLWATVGPLWAMVVNYHRLNRWKTPQKGPGIRCKSDKMQKLKHLSPPYRECRFWVIVIHMGVYCFRGPWCMVHFLIGKS